MAFFLFCNNDPSSFTRIFILAFLVYSLSYCSSLPTYSIGTSNIDIGNDNSDIDERFFGQKYPYRRLVFDPEASIHDVNIVQYPMLSKHRIENLLTKAALLQVEDRPHQQHYLHANNRRYASQSFHAMRG